MNPRPGEVGLADLGLSAKTRPVVIVSRFDLDAPRALAIYVPLTTRNRNSLYKVPIPRLAFLNEISVANVQGLASIPTIRLERKLGKLPDNAMVEIRRALSFALDLRPAGE
jgi:mRNA interferase MazF